MNDFPSEMITLGGWRLSLDGMRLAIGTTGEQTPDGILELVGDLGVEIEFGDDSDERPETVANNPTLFWLWDTLGEPIDEDRFQAIRDALGEVLDWIGPVYRVGDTQGRAGIVCPLPHALVIWPIEGLDDDGQDQLTALLASYDCSELPEISADLNGQRYFMRDAANQSAIYPDLDGLRSAGAGLAAAVDLHLVYMALPFSTGPTNDPMDHDSLAPSHVDEAVALFGPGPAPPIVVAVIDCGVDLDHLDLDFHGVGYNIDIPDRLATIGPPSNGRPVRKFDANLGLVRQSHGTHMAGIIGMIHNNNRGGSGVAPNVKILPIAMTTGGNVDLARAINIAAAEAQVINMSWGVPSIIFTPAGPVEIPADPLVDQALAKAHANGVVLCAAAGQGFDPLPSSHPANNPKVIACTTWDPTTQNHGDFSRTGPELSVAAPMRSVKTTAPRREGNMPDKDYHEYGLGDGRAMSGGTSSACAVVSGIAALICRRFPGISPEAVRRTIERSAVKAGTMWQFGTEAINGLHTNGLGYGLIDAFRALDFADVYVRRYQDDTGRHPTPLPYGLNEQSEVVVSAIDFQTASMAYQSAPSSRSGDVVPSATNYLYARVWNDGPAAARKVTASARVTPVTGQPFAISDWRSIDLDHIELPLDPAMASVPVLAAGSSAIFKFTLSLPVVALMQAGMFAGIRFAALVEATSENDYAHASASFATDELEHRRNNLARRDLNVAIVV